MSEPAVLIATARIRHGQDQAFAAWKAHHDTVIGKFAGFVSSDIMPPIHEGSNEWIIVLNFQSKGDLVVWQQSKEREALIAEGMPLFEDGNFGEFVQLGHGAERPKSDVTEVIFSRLKPGMEDTYREWAARIQTAQAKYPGYRGMFLQPPNEKGGTWTSFIRFESPGQLEAWMNSPERKELLSEGKTFIEHEQLARLATSFPGWVPLDPATGKGPPNWKTAMLVLLGLFPVVMLELKYLNPVLAKLGLHASLATFIGNVISVALTSFLTMPWFVSSFGWWLFPKAASAATTARGVLILLGLYVAEILVLWPFYLGK